MRPVFSSLQQARVEMSKSELKDVCNRSRNLPRSPATQTKASQAQAEEFFYSYKCLSDNLEK